METIKNCSLAILLSVFSTIYGYSQTIFSENFETVTYPNLPTLWSTTTLGTDGGFYTGNSDSARLGMFWLVTPHTKFAMSNDDVCICDKSNDYLLMPSINLSGYVDSTVFLKFDAWMENLWGGIGTIKVDTGSGWIDIYTMSPTPNWQTRVVNLTPFAGASNVVIAFHYNDQYTSGLGLAIDNISIYVPSNQHDVAIYNTSNTYSNYFEIPFSQLSPIKLNSIVYNNGKDTLYNVKLIAETSTNFKDTSLIGILIPAEYKSTSFSNNWTISSKGLFNVSYTAIHSNSDDFTGNNNTNEILQVADSVLAKENGTIDDAQILQDGETIAQTFRVFQKDTLTSISIHLLLTNATDNIKFYIYSMVGGLPTTIIDSSQTIPSLTAGWSTHYLPSGIVLDTGDYAIGVKKIGTGLTYFTATKTSYVPNTTFTTHYFMVDFFWYMDEQSYGGATLADHHTYLIRPNFGKKLTVGINPIFAKNNTQFVYPNPSTGLLNIVTQEKIEQIIVYDLSGKLVYEKQNVSASQFDFSFLNKGMYFGKVKTTNNLQSFKLIMD